ncbi:LysR substrate-binding domain-containing protein [Antarcticimicrobium luteum]|uniref:LysR family transcriptional regulator n=1 Tax=Antarcticimicrobium luteum TaxID=2547397 RepID=A0A4R5UQ39_9RHOB|nr:LysR substrate-binding domain-containing protein [Antarcticimicrobium luteum]TDK41132.1 LysR family transcriptional regulator [Antarcticimicrobium luteum]
MTKGLASSRIRMRHLRCFLSVAHLGSVTRAAEAMGTVQPAVSRSLRELEEELGSPLFDRTAAGLVLNAAGNTLFSYVSGGIGQIDRGLEALQGQIADQRVVAYVLPNVVRVVMPGAVRRFKTLSPSVDLRFIATTGGGLQQYLRSGEVDFGFGRLLSAEHMQGMNFEHLYSEPLVFFVRAGHPLAGRQGLTIGDVDRYPVVIPIPGTIIRDELDRFLISQGLSRFSNMIETISFEFARSYLAMSEAVVCQPLGAMRRELEQAAAECLDVAGGAMDGAVGLTTPAGQTVSAPAQLLMQMIREEVRGLGLTDGSGIAKRL